MRTSSEQGESKATLVLLTPLYFSLLGCSARPWQ